MRTVVVSIPPCVPKVTLLLVLGHYFEGLVGEGMVRDYAEIARATGPTRARVTQICNLTMLAPEIQEAILELKLTVEGEDPMHERCLRAVVSEPDWQRQLRTWSRQFGASPLYSPR